MSKSADEIKNDLSRPFAIKFLYFLSYNGIFVAIVAFVIRYFAPTTVLPFIPAFLLLSASILTLVALRKERAYLAAHIFMVASMFLMFLIGRISFESFLLSTAGYQMVLIASVILLPLRELIPYVIVSIGCVIWNHIDYISRAPSIVERDAIIALGFPQYAFLFAGICLIVLMFKTGQQTIDKLRNDRRLLENHSAELEASNQALAASEARYRTLVENATEAIVVTELETWKIVDANAHALAIFGYSLEELKQFTVKDLVSKNLDKSLSEAFALKREQLHLGNPIEFFTMHTDSNGRDFESEVRLILLPGTSPQLVRGTVIDITERRRNEYIAQEADRRLRLLIENMPARAGYFDPQYKIVSGNNAFRQLTANQDVETMLVEDVVGSEIFALCKPYMDRALGGETLTFEMEGRYKDGVKRVSATTYVPHFVEGNVDGVFAMTHDATDARRSERELQETTAFLRLITDNMPARLAYVLKDGTLFFVNRQYELAGIDVETVSGEHYLQLVPEESHPQVVSMVGRALNGERVSAEMRYTRPSGSEAIDNVLIVPNHTAEGIHGFIMLISDFTEQRQAEDSLRQRQRLESLGILAGGIAHDFNNLLVAMLGQSSLAAAKMAEDHPARRHVSRATDAAERAAMLTRQMLAYSGRGSFAIAPFNLNQVISDNLRLFETSIDHTIRLAVDLDRSIDMIEGDTAQFQQIVMNLLLNAAQAMGNKPGTITVSTGAIAFEEGNKLQWKYTATAPKPGRYVKLEVKDSGVGMDAKTRDSIFDPFFTTKETGSGLGLAAVLGIVRGHNGVINVDSEPGVGTTFSLYFPAAATEQIVAEVSAKTQPEKIDVERHVLIIDDDQSVTESVADMLEFDDIKVLQANSGASGIQLYRDRQAQIGLVLLDLTMPEMGGEEVFHALREIDPEVQVILSSGYSREEATSHFVGRSLADFLQKPYHHETLRARIHTLFTRELANVTHEAGDTTRAIPKAESQLTQ